MATDYATTAELKERTSIEAANTNSDTLLQQLLDAAAYIVDQVARNPHGCNRLPVGKQAFSASASEVRYFDDDGLGVVLIDDLLTYTSITRAGVALLATQFALKPYNPGNGPWTELLLYDTAGGLIPGVSIPYGYPYKGVGVKQIAITGTWGYCTAGNRPAVIKEATLTQAARLYERMAVQPAELIAGYRDPYKTIDPIVLAMLAPVAYEVPAVSYWPING